MKLIEDLGMLYPDTGSKSRKFRYGLYECPICKKRFKTQTTLVKNGRSTKCKSCSISKTHSTHKESKSRLYNTWCNMKARCYNKKNRAYKWYGNNGVSVCEEWKYNYLNFKSWAELNGYNEELTIDRIDSEGNYEPNNCRWVTMDVQLQNTRRLRSTNTSGYRGVHLDKSINKWKVIICVNKNYIYLGHYNTVEEGAKVYDNYIIANNLEHTINNIKG